MVVYSALVLPDSGKKTRFVDFKLNLARNIHDETNPALLYAKMLAKNRRTNQLREEKDELEIHIEHTMELIRNLSQDLKSDQQWVLDDLLKDTRTMLDKISVLSDFSYSIRDSLDKKRFLSYYQYSNLKAILQECITNSIKHADFKHMDITFAVESSLLKISYRDDGKGWPVDQQVNGHGLQNIRDRIKKLNGDLVIKNNYPHGFRIDMNMKLS
ncbi:MAG: hypothetical protein KL787_11090 [Taibaiella sp.]|nr:hypothetical protein [Taibaiella sp.]